MEEKTRVKFSKGERRVMLYESDREVDMAEITECCNDNGWKVPEENSNDYWEKVDWIREPEWDDFVDNLKYSSVFPKQVVVVGTAGLWDGNRTIRPTVLDTTDIRSFWSRFIPSCCEYEVHIGYDKQGGLFVEVPHHDGTNFYHIRELTERGAKYFELREDNGIDYAKLEKAPYSRKIDWYIF